MQNELEKYIHANREAFDGEEPGADVWENIQKRFVEKPGKLEQFVQANREAFDMEEPGTGVWNNLEQTFAKKTAQAPVVYMRTIVKLVSVAAVVAVIALSAWYFTSRNAQTIAPAIAQTNNTGVPAGKDTPGIVQPLTNGTKANPPEQDKIADAAPVTKDNSAAAGTGADAEDDYKQEIFYYTKLSEIKFNELKKIEKDQPALYHSFAGEIKKLDSAYHGLQTMLKGNVDKETILAAMIANLKMQTEILSKQLYIIHSLKKDKKTGYENKNTSI